MAIPRLTGPLSRYPCAIFCGPDMILIVNGSEPAKHRLQPHTRARHSSWRACASDALQAARVASEAGTTCSCCTSQLHQVCSQCMPRPLPAALLSCRSYRSTELIRASLCNHPPYFVGTPPPVGGLPPRWTGPPLRSVALSAAGGVTTDPPLGRCPCREPPQTLSLPPSREPPRALRNRRFSL